MLKEKFQCASLSKAKSSKYSRIPYIQAAVALPLTYFVLTRLPVAGPVQATVEVVAILIGVHIGSFAGLYLFMRHSIKIPVAWKSIAKYILAALVMGIVLFLLPTTTTLAFNNRQSHRRLRTIRRFAA